MTTETTTHAQDTVARAMINDGSFRAIAAHTTNTIRDACAAHGLTGPLAQLYGELLTGAILTRETMAPDQRVQVALRSVDGNLMADAHPGGMTRGLAHAPSGALALGPDTLLEVTRVMFQGELHQGVVPTNPQFGITGAFMRYMLSSEQVRSAVDINVVLDADGGIAEAGGYMVQLLPQAEDAEIERMTEYLGSLPRVRQWFTGEDGMVPVTTAQQIVERLFQTHAPDEWTLLLADGPVHFGCTCSEVRILGALSTLGAEEIQSIINANETVEITCDYCNTDYAFGPHQLRTLLEVS